MFWDLAFGGGYYGGYDDFGGPDRRGWKDKSDAAMRRENEAKALFDQFVENSKSSPTFPVTQEIVPPHIHLTDACWKTFRQYVISKGCTTKRRQATQEERIASKEKRKGKLWFISATVPVHPSKAQQAAVEKKQAAAAAAAKKKERAAAAAEKKRLEQQAKAAQAAQLQAKVKAEYATLEASLDKSGLLFQDQSNNNDSKKKESTAEPKKKKLKMTPLSVPRDAMLEHADKQHQAQLRQIQVDVEKAKMEERQELLSQLDAKMQAKQATLGQQAQEYYNLVKQSIMENSSSTVE